MWKKSLRTSILTLVCTFSLIKFFLAYLLTQAKDLAGKASCDGNLTYLNNNNCPDSSKTPHVWPQNKDLPNIYCPPVCTHWPLSHIFLYKPRSIFSILETVFETEIVVCYLPGVDLTEINSFLVSTPPVSLCLWILSAASSWIRSIWDPWRQVSCTLGPWLQYLPSDTICKSGLSSDRLDLDWRFQQLLPWFN